MTILAYNWSLLAAIRTPSLTDILWPVRKFWTQPLWYGRLAAYDTRAMDATTASFPASYSRKTTGCVRVLSNDLLSSMLFAATFANLTFKNPLPALYSSITFFRLLVSVFSRTIFRICLRCFYINFHAWHNSSVVFAMSWEDAKHFASNYALHLRDTVTCSRKLVTLMSTSLADFLDTESSPLYCFGATWFRNNSLNGLVS